MAAWVAFSSLPQGILQEAQKVVLSCFLLLTGLLCESVRWVGSQGGDTAWSTILVQPGNLSRHNHCAYFIEFLWLVCQRFLCMSP